MGWTSARRSWLRRSASPGEGSRKKRHEETRKFATFARALDELAEWLVAEQVTHVAMEATSDHWRPVWWVLEQAGLKMVLVNARDVHQLPGRKTDVTDPAWLAQLLECGLLRSSFVHPPEIRELRDLPGIANGWSETAPTKRNVSRRSWRTPASSCRRSRRQC